jgi:hypothetical protein
VAEDGVARGIAEAALGETVGLTDFVTWSEWALARVGFRPSNCLAVVDVCRDELMSPVEEAIEGCWGRAFQVGSLAGIVLTGRTGMQAALSHVPGEDGRHRFVAFCLPHIGIDEDGTIGHVQRRGMHRASAACGALVAVSDRWQEGARGSRADQAVESDDIEMSLLWQRVAAHLEPGTTPSLVELTMLTRDLAVSDLERYIRLATADEPVDVAYISGIVVHLPDGEDRIAAVVARVMIDGVEQALPH